MPTLTAPPATLDDLMRVEGKAELIGGRIEPIMPTGRIPSLVAKWIMRHLDDYSVATGVGEVHPDNIGFALPHPLANGRESFSPDVSYYVGPFDPNGMAFIRGTPTLAVEVRSESDYGASAEDEMAEKRADYFAAGTLVVWDVDPVNGVIHRCRADDPDNPTTFRDGEIADAEPAVPGWRMPVDVAFARLRP